MSYFPAFLDIREKRCVVVGGGNVASQKVRALLKSKACVEVVSPRLTPALQKLVQKGTIGWISRDFTESDLRGAFLAIAATDDAAVNKQVWDAAERGRVLLNAVDDPPHCHFVFPSIFRRGKLQVAISTGGASPVLAKRIRKELGKSFGPEYATALDWMGGARRVVSQRVEGQRRRKALFSALADTNIPAGIKRYGKARAKKRFDRRLHELLAEFGKN